MREPVSPVSVQQSPQLFATLCAAHIGGYDDGVPESEMSQLQAAVRREIVKAHGPAVETLREFYRNHELADPAASLSRYVSYGLVVGEPPRFEFQLNHEDLPPDVLALEGFAGLLTAYYGEAQLNLLYEQVKPAYAKRAADLERLVGQITLVETGYVRQILQPSAEHTFTVFIEPLVGARSNFRIYGGRYSLVMDPSLPASADEVRHSLLHFLLDSLALAHHPPLAGRKAILDVVARAPRLPGQLREDVEALTDECLVKAVELRIQHLPAAKAQAALDAAEADGLVLVRPIYNGLEAYEKGEDPLSAYYPKLIQKIDLTAEAKRMAGVRFAAAEAPSRQARETHVVAPQQELSELDRWLAEGEAQLAQKDTRAARATFQRILEKFPGVPRAQYGLAVAIIVDGEVDRGKGLLDQVVSELTNPASVSQGSGLGAPQAGAAQPSIEPDPRTLAWAHIWLGRIYAERGRAEQAGVEYRAALAVEGAPETARAAAQRGLDAGRKNQSP